MKEKTKREEPTVTDRGRWGSDLSDKAKAEVRRRVRMARRYKFPWLLIIAMLVVFMIVFVIATYFSGSG